MDFKTIYIDTNIRSNNNYIRRANQIVSQYPDARKIEVNSHWNIKELSNMDPSLWMKTKRDYLVLGIKKDLTQQENGRSSDYIANSHSNGCLSGCTYCVLQGSLIKTPDGLIPVEQIQDGSHVISWNSLTEQLESEQIGYTSCRDTDEIYDIEVQGQVVSVTGEHPFYVKNKGWVEAQNLTIEDEVLCVSFYEAQ